MAPPQTTFQRRELLALLGISSASGLTGCLSYLDDDVQLAGVNVANLTTGVKTVYVRVLNGDDEVHSSVHEIQPSTEENSHYVLDETFVECIWSSESGQYVVEARLDDTDWESLDLTDEGDDDCYLATVFVREEEDVGEGRMYMFGQAVCDRDLPHLCESDSE